MTKFTTFLLSLCILQVLAAAKTVMETIAERPDLSVLAAIMNNSYPPYSYGLSGNETFFAPTNEAFARYWDQRLLQFLQQPEWNAHARTFLHYHTVREMRLSSKDLEQLEKVPSWTRSPFGTPYQLTINQNPLRINDNATILEPNITADNSTIHIIDGVLEPPFFTTLWAAAQDFPLLNTLVELVEVAGLQHIFEGPGPLTVLAPNDVAFEEAFSTDEMELLKAPENRDFLTALLLQHLLRENAYTFTFINRTEVVTYGHTTLPIDMNVTAETLSIGNASVIVPNQRVRNGVAHVMGAVILPPAGELLLNGADTESAATTRSAIGSVLLSGLLSLSAVAVLQLQ